MFSREKKKWIIRKMPRFMAQLWLEIILDDSFEPVPSTQQQNKSRAKTTTNTHTLAYSQQPHNKTIHLEIVMTLLLLLWLLFLLVVGCYGIHLIAFLLFLFCSFSSFFFRIMLLPEKKIIIIHDREPWSFIVFFSLSRARAFFANTDKEWLWLKIAKNKSGRA